MYLTKIILNGFKSYPNITVIEDFDRHFNAITGLNGSGKSNVLDAICFVFGVNLSKVRATQLQELIYKSGTAGVYKALVSLVFINNDHSTSPTGYEEVPLITVARQVCISGKNKYTINGTTVQAGKMADFFKSAHLHVNNPHFMILQGKITQVLNMRPKEILEMVQTAAGTTTYVGNSAEVLKTIEEKNCKLNEIQNLVSTEISPSIETLQSQKSEYLELQNIERQLNRLEHAHMLDKYNGLRCDAEAYTKEIEGLTADSEENRKRKVDLAQEIKDYEIRGQEDGKNSGLIELQKLIVDAERKHHKINIKEAEIQGELKAIDKGVKDLEDSLDSNSNQISECDKQLKKREGNTQNMAEKMNDQKAKVDELNKQIHIINERKKVAASDGMVINPFTGQAVFINDLLIELQAKLAEAESGFEAIQHRLSRYESDYKQKRLSARDQRLAEQYQDELERLHSQLDMGGESSKLGGLDQQKIQITRNIESIQRQLANAPETVHYNDPCPNFDRNKRVLGQLGRLIRCKEPEKFARAIEAAIGTGRLFNIVVDKVDTGKLMLSKCNFERRMTFIPINGVNVPRDVSKLRALLETAQRIANGRPVWPALSLVDFDEQIRPCVEFALATKFICADLETAKLIAFHPSMGGRTTITLDGDIFDPSGVLTGGADKNSANGGARLKRLGYLGDLELKLGQYQNDLKEIDSKISHLERSRNEKLSLRAKYDDLAQKLTAMGLDDVKKLEDDIASAKTLRKECQEKIAEYGKHINELVSSGTAKPISKGPSEAVLKQDLQRSGDVLKEMCQQIKVLELEIRDIRTEMESTETNSAELRQQIAVLNMRGDELKETLRKISSELNDASDAVQYLKDQRALVVSQKDSIDKKISELQNCINEIDLKLRQIDLSIKSAVEKQAQCVATLEELVKKHSWLTRSANTEANVSAENLTAMRSKRKMLKRVVNVNVMDMLADKEREYELLMKKKGIVLENKQQLQTSIATWDEIKKTTIMSSWKTISADFGNIFSTLLPGAFARLALPGGMNGGVDEALQHGLEIKVSLGNVWKESLTELSGGQRSLAAMSLTLAVLRYKPAPLYIMDEIDAALDLSHTQNIGVMIKRFFKESQFIVVSLKDGMFKNANVLFKTVYKDGVSTVSRQENKRH